MQQQPAIEIQNLVHQYGKFTAVDDLSFSVQAGEVVGFLGPNGAGKSTTLRILSGLMPATSGHASICGLSVASHPRAIRGKIGYMPETNPLPDELRVSEYLKLRAALKGIPKKKRSERCEKVMEICDLNRKARKKIIGMLSKGFRQRVGIADALLAEPDIIILDEPTIGLDPHQVIQIRKLIDQLRGKMTVILSSHILSEIEMSCDKVIIINHGRLIAEGSHDALRKQFIPYTKLILETNAKAQELIVAFKETGIQASIQKSEASASKAYYTHTVHLESDSPSFDKIAEHLVKTSHFKLRQMRIHRPNLEEVFLASTRQSWREADDMLDTQPPKAQ